MQTVRIPIPVIGLLTLTFVGCADAGTLAPDAGTLAPDAGNLAADAGNLAADAEYDPANDATLKSLSLVYTNGKLYPQTPEFDTDTSTYTIDVGFWLKEIQVLATPNNDDASITISSGSSVSIGDVILLGRGTTQISITVTAPGGAEQIYTLRMNRALGVDEFGYAVSLSGDTLAVGAPYEDSDATDSGAVYIFIQENGVWTEQGRLKASNAGEGDQFGYAVSLSGDTLAVGAPYEDSDADGSGDSTADSGAVYIFTRLENGMWTDQGRLKASNADVDDQFGYAVSLSGDTLAVGAPYDNDADGAVHVFVRSDDTGAWSHKARATVFSGIPADAYFGFAVSLSDDTEALAVGAPGVDFGESDWAPDSGAVYVFDLDVSSDTYMVPTTNLWASNPQAYARFGYAVSLSGDTLAVGAPFEDSDDSTADSGAVYVFTLPPSDGYPVVRVGASDPSEDDQFGYAVSLSGDTLAVGAPFEVSDDDDSATANGAVYFFTRPSGEEWSQQGYVNASNLGEDGRFGFAVSFSGDTDTLAVGAYGNDSDATISFSDNGDDADGAVYLFQ